MPVQCLPDPSRLLLAQNTILYTAVMPAFVYIHVHLSPKVVEETVDPEKERKSRQQVENSELRLDKLSTDGSELVSNVMVAEDAREVQYRQEQEEARKARSDIHVYSTCN